MTKFPVRVNGFSDFCDSYSLDQKGDVLQVSGNCAPDPRGAQKMGAALFASHINIDQCLYNDNGNLVPRAHGGALSSCNCDVGFYLCDTCNRTSLQCSCLNASATDRKVTLMDMNEFLGIGLDEQGRLVLYCDGVYGDWVNCVKNGAGTECPSLLR
ncbi:hypothetical protein KVR01_012911 [Diaporthe batatas]|uniref:uncharacterized protein n=1 Tax=Diaporthe batatas TaxID=748121 RepID=UPI001D04BEC1|nr:uncharacterized protein KVR01_012911 [Diaporthe batatas]KAG8157203.1 hypothetical protein KVR01_012911 [Diaporthe batatas]